jgi:hypothetical protein
LKVIDKTELNKRNNKNRKDKGRDNSKFKQEKLFDKEVKTENNQDGPITVGTTSQETAQDKDEKLTLD